MIKRPLSPHTIAAQAGHFVNAADGALTPPLQPGVTFARNRDYALIHENRSYARAGTSIVDVAEDLLAQFENAAASQLHPSGMAAIASLLRAVPSGSTVLLQSQIYWGTADWLRQNAARMGLTLVEGDLSVPSTLTSLISEHSPALVMIETPSNPWLRVTDIAQAAELTHAAGGKLVVDGTAATPILTRALDHGADFALHSATKAINGHSDLMAGVVSTNAVDDPMWQTMLRDRAAGGAILGSFEAWLLVRGMRTLPLRVDRMSASAMDLATRLAGHDAVDQVMYPGLPSDPGHGIARGQMSAFGGLLSIVVKGGAAAALAAAGKMEIFHRATSLGSVESLVEHRHSIEPHTGIPEGLLRLSIGLEDVDDLWADLDQALSC